MGGKRKKQPTSGGKKKKKQQLTDAELAAKLLAAEREKEAKLRRIIAANIEDIKNTQSSSYPTAPPERKPHVSFTKASTLLVGEYVKVTPDTSPGKNRPLGYGYITNVEGAGASAIASVKYHKAWGGLLYHDVPYSAITISLHGTEMFQDSVAEGKGKRAVSEEVSQKKDVERDSRPNVLVLVEKLTEGCRSNRADGWYRRELQLWRKDAKDMPTRMSEVEKARLLGEANALRSYLAGKRGDASPYFQQGKGGRIKKRNAKHDPASLKYLVQHAWGRNSSYLHDLEAAARKRMEEQDIDGSVFFWPPDPSAADETGAKSVIEDREAAEKQYSAAYLFALSKCREISKKDSASVDKDTHGRQFSEFMKAYASLGADAKAVWEAKRREHLEKQPYVKDIIIDALMKNPRRSWRELEKDLQYWCSYSTIRRWVMSKEGFKYYTERIIPLLSPAQRKKHLEFARHFRNNWGLGPGKYILIMFDEKWFWGLVLRNHAKAIKELGIDKHSFAAYHRNHINKTMAVAFTAFAFEDSIENGGRAHKLGFYRAQSKKVAEKTVRASVRMPNGRIKRTGPVVKEKGKLYPTDVSVTGSDPGTAKNPKFPLKTLFEHKIFPDIEELVGKGGKFEGYTPIIQGDNAGPHAEAEFVKYVKDYCDSKGWYWEPQAPQMPHMNVLDLSVFPNMSKRHTSLCREQEGLKVLAEDEIWDAAAEVWRTLPECKIASAYVQAHRIAAKIIKEKGSNAFLGAGGSIHVGVGADFYETDDGLARKDGMTVAAPPRTRD